MLSQSCCAGTSAGVGPKQSDALQLPKPDWRLAHPVHSLFNDITASGSQQSIRSFQGTKHDSIWWAQVNVDKYQEWIQLVSEFTVSSLNSWQWASGSIHYLLGLWSRLVSSSAYLKGESPSLLETYAPKIIEAYITSRYRFALQLVIQHAAFCSHTIGRLGVLPGTNSGTCLALGSID